MVYDTVYRVRESIEVRIRDLSKVGPVIDLALAHGITEISPIRFSATDTRLTHEEAVREATELARRQAEIIATAAGGHLGPVISLGTQALYPDYYDRYSSFSLRGVTVTSAEPSAATEITAPSVTVAVTVYGRWRFARQP